MLILPDTVTLREATQTLQMLEQAARRDTEPVLQVDASALREFDSSALAVLLECRRLAGAAGRGFAVRAAPPKLASLAKLYGIDRLIGLQAAG